MISPVHLEQRANTQMDDVLVRQFPVGTPQMSDEAEGQCLARTGQSALPDGGFRIKSTLTRRDNSEVKTRLAGLVDDEQPDVSSILARFRSSLKVGTASEYIPIPQPLAVPRPGSACWRIELHGLEPSVPPIGFDILDDVVIGRGVDADIDLEPYEGFSQAVSRRHALLRPSPRQLHLIDLGSKNGTFHNTVPLATCATYVLKSDDVISLGLLTFTIKIVDGPFITLQ